LSIQLFGAPASGAQHTHVVPLDRGCVLSERRAVNAARLSNPQQRPLSEATTSSKVRVRSAAAAAAACAPA
jgi:hypothetical protein